MVNDGHKKKKKTVLPQEEDSKTSDNEEEKVPRKRKIALLSDDVDFVRGKKASQPEAKPLKVESDNIFVSCSKI